MHSFAAQSHISSLSNEANANHIPFGENDIWLEPSHRELENVDFSLWVCKSQISMVSLSTNTSARLLLDSENFDTKWDSTWS